MSDIAFKYSEFFEDDGGMTKVKTDFVKLGDEIIAEAKRVKKEVNESFSFDNTEVLARLESKVEDLEKTMKGYKTAKGDLDKIDKEHNRTLGEQIALDDRLIKSKTKLTGKTSEEIVNQRELAKMSDLYAKKQSSLLPIYDKVAAKHAILAKTYKELLLKQELGISFTARETAQLGYLEKRYEKYDSALRKAEQGAGQYFRSIGNYKSAYDGLGNSINQLTRELPAFTYSAQTGILALSNNIPILTDEIGRLNKANQELRSQGKPVKSALTAILEGVFSLQTAMGIGILILTLYGKEIAQFIEDAFSNAKALREQAEWLKRTNEFLKDRKKALEEGSEFERELIKNFEAQTNQLIRLRNARGENDQKNAIEERNTNLQRVKLYKKATETEIEFIEKLEGVRQRNYVKQLARLERQKKKDEEVASRNSRSVMGIGKTNTDGTSYEGLSPRDIRERADKRIAELKRAAFRQQEVAKEELAQKKKEKTELLIQEINYTKELEILQEQQKTDRLRNLLEITQDRKVTQAEAQRLLLENEIKNNEEILSSDKYTAEQRIAAQAVIVDRMRKLNKLNRQTELQELKYAYEKQHEEIKKNADGTVVTQKYVNDLLLELYKKYNADRQIVQENYIQAEKETDLAARKILLLQTLDFQIQKLKADQKYYSTSAAQFEAYFKQIREVQDKIDKITNQKTILNQADTININDAELARLTEFQQRIKDSFGDVFPTALSKKQQKQYLGMVKAFEKETLDIAEDADIQRKLARLNQIEDEKKTAESSIEIQKLEIEKQGILIDLKNKEIKKSLDGNKTILDGYKDFSKELFPLLDKILDRLLQMNQKRIDSEKNLLEAQKDSVQTQEDRARQGLANTLAFEQAMQAKREADLVRSQKKQERLEKVKALYTSYTNYSNKGDKNPIQKALRDFAILEAISASFGDGGAADDVLKDKIPHDGKGIIRGRSHRGRQGGIPVLIEGKEGFFSGREMANLGKTNFYKMKEMASLGRVDSNFFTAQGRNFMQAVPVAVGGGNNQEIIAGLEDLKHAIENKPVSNWRVDEVADGIMKMTETIETKNKTKRNHYVIKKERL